MKVRRRWYQAFSLGGMAETSSVKCDSLVKGRRVDVKLGERLRMPSPLGKMLNVVNRLDGCSSSLVEVRKVVL